MYRIDNASAVTSLPAPGPPGTPGYFTDGNPAAALEATIVDAWWLNMLQEELLTVIEGVGITPSKTNRGQLYQALQQIFASGSFLPIAGGTMTGFIELHHPPVLPMHAANKQYVDQEVANVLAGGGYVALPPTGDNILYGQRNRLWTNIADYFLPLTGGQIYSGGPDPLRIATPSGQTCRIDFDELGYRRWRIGIDISGNFQIRDDTGGVTPLMVNLGNGGVAINNGDLFLSRSDQAAAWIVRPANPGLRYLGICCEGAVPLVNLTVAADASYFTGSVFSYGTVSAGTGAYVYGLYPGGHPYGLIVETPVQFRSELAVTGHISAGSLTVPYGHMTAGGTGLSVSGGAFSVNGTLDAPISGNVRIYTALTVDGGTNLTGGLGVWNGIACYNQFDCSGSAYVAGTLNVNGVVGMNQHLTVAGNLSANDFTLNGQLFIGGSGGVAGGLTLSGNIGANWGTFGGGVSVGLTLQVNGNATIYGDVYTNAIHYPISDRRVKGDPQPLQREAMLEAIRPLQPVSYTLNSDKRHYGLLSQDVAETVLCDAVATGPGGNLYLDYNHILAALVGAVQQLDTRIAALESREG